MGQSTSRHAPDSQHTRPRRKRFSLGAAIFGLTPANGYAGPAEQAPDAWLLRLRELSTEDELLGVFQAGRAGRDWVLTSADSATLTLDLTAGQASQKVWRRRLDALRGHLAARGEHGRTTLHIICTRKQSTSPAFQLVATFLADSGRVFDKLVLDTPESADTPDSAVLTAFLQTAAPGLGRLESLFIECGRCSLPAPAVLPSLRELRMDVRLGDPQQALAAALESITPYLGQLVCLGVGFDEPKVGLLYCFPWWLLFPSFTVSAAATARNTRARAAAAASAAAATASTAAASTATVAASSAAAPKLTSFSTTYDLNDTLLTTLLHHAPALETLSVGSIAMQQDYSDRQWGLRNLEVLEGVWHTELMQWYEGMYMPTLVRLPVCCHGERVLVGGFNELKLFATSEEGLDESIRDRLCDFTFNVSEEVGIYPDRSLPLADQPAAFKSMLQQLVDLKLDNKTTVVTRGWHWTVDMLRIAAGYVPALDHLRLRMYVWCEEPLTDEHLSLALQLSDHQLVSVFEGLSLQSDQYSDAKWPFLGLTFTEPVNVADLVKLPRPDESTKAVLWCCKLVIDSRSITEVGTERLCAWLQHVKWTHPDMSLRFWKHMTITLRCPQDDSAMQRAQLQVLRAMQLDEDTDVPESDSDLESIVQAKITVVLDGWQLTHTAMDTLASEGLPEWASQIDFSLASFTLQPSEYTRLAQCVPVSYITWHTSARYGSKLLESITQGINARRGGLGLTRIVVTLPEPDGPEHWLHTVGKHYILDIRVDSEYSEYSSDWDEPQWE